LGCVELWRDFPERLAATTQCNYLVYDRLGYGKSGPFENPVRDIHYLEPEAALLHQLLVAHNIENAILFGHSDGGSIALLTAALFPERIHALITEGAHVFVEEVTLAGIRAAQEAYGTTDLPQRLAKYHGAHTDALVKAWTETWLAPTFRDWNLTAFLPKITCPALIIQGEDDEFGTPAQVEAIVEGCSGPAQAWMIPGVQHNPHKEVPEEVIAHVFSFVTTLP
jgi:pimeloyl-ACP methyl ester carboxylesterase